MKYVLLYRFFWPGHSYIPVTLIFNCICPSVTAEDAAISAFPPDFRVCLCCDLQQSYSLTSNTSAGSQVTKHTKLSWITWSQTRISVELVHMTQGLCQFYAFTSVSRPVPGWQVMPKTVVIHTCALLGWSALPTDLKAMLNAKSIWQLPSREKNMLQTPKLWSYQEHPVTLVRPFGNYWWQLLREKLLSKSDDSM